MWNSGNSAANVRSPEIDCRKMGSVDVAVPQGSRERDMHDHLEDGELDVEDGEVPAEGTLQVR